MTEIERLLSEGFITEDFLKEEVRCDYLVSAEMKKAWAIQLDLMVKLFEVCKKHRLRVYATFGTMLGAVRHNGFIPWDDDSDLFMPREDYDKLIQLAPSEFSDPYFLSSEYSDGKNNMYITFARLCNSRTYVNENVCDVRNVTWNSGIFIDIFPLDGVPNCKVIIYMRHYYLKALTIIHHAYTINRNRHWLPRVINKVLHLPFIPYNSFNAIQRIHRIAKKTDYNKASHVSDIVFSPYDLKKNIFEKVDWEGTEWFKFENIEVPVPQGFDKILKIFYGDYHKFPPLEKRGNWHALEFDAETPYKQKLSC